MLDEIRAKVVEGLYEFSRHAVDRMTLRHITVCEVREALMHGEIIEDYPEDKTGPSCLVLGMTLNGRALHVHCSYPPRPLVKIITVYEPDPSEWMNSRLRRS